MLYRVELMTRDRVTIESDSDEDAKERAEKLVRSINAQNNHGEKVFYRVVSAEGIMIVPEEEDTWQFVP